MKIIDFCLTVMALGSPVTIYGLLAVSGDIFYIGVLIIMIGFGGWFIMKKREEQEIQTSESVKDKLNKD